MSQNENSEAIAIQPSSMAPNQEVISANQDFSVGLCSCFEDCGLTWKTAFCPFLTFSSTQKTLPEGSKNCVPCFTLGWILAACTAPALSCAGSCLAPSTLANVTIYAQFPQLAGVIMQIVGVYYHRKVIKEKDNLKPMDFSDCLIATFFGTLAIIQHERHTHPSTFVVLPVTTQPVAQ